MRVIELEIECKDEDEAKRLDDRLLNGQSYIGRKHGKWFVFISCPPSGMMHLGMELHYELDNEGPQ